MRATPLQDAADPSRFGGKSASLARALVAGVPVPDGAALEVALVDAIVAREPAALVALAAVRDALTGLLAVRSSALGEDGAGASFAGQHETVLGVDSLAELTAAVRRIHASARAPAARAYRARRGVAGEPRMAVLVQPLVAARAAGVMFTRDPLTGDDVLVIEAALGLGELVVSGDVTPDRFRVDRRGRVLERERGEQDEALLVVDGAVQRTALDPRPAPCLADADLAALAALADRLDRVFPPPHDVEFAFSPTGLVLLQRRPVTAR